MSTCYLRIWLYLEKGSFQMELVKMRLHCLRVGLKSSDQCPFKRRDPCKGKETGAQLQAKECQALLEAMGSWEMERSFSSLEPSERAWPCGTLISDLWFSGALRK